MWVLKRHSDGFYVTTPNVHNISWIHGYSSNLCKAQRFVSEEKAKQDKYGDEIVVTVESQLT